MRLPEAWPLAAAATVAVAAVLGGAFYPGQQLAVGVLLVLVVALLGAEPGRLSEDAEERMALALVGCGALAAAAGGFAPLAAKQAVAGWLVAWCLWIGARRASPRGAAAAAAVLTAAALLMAAGVGLEAAGLQSLRVGGLFENPNIVAALLVTALPLVGLGGVGGHRSRVVVAAALVMGIGLTGSRAGLLALVVVAAAALPRGRPRIAGLLVGGVAVAVLVVVRFIHQPEVLAWYRPAIWLAVLKLWGGHPLLGVGPGALTDAAGPVRLLHADQVAHHPYLITYAESTPLGLLAQTGILGFIVAAVAILLWLRRAGRAGFLAQPRLRAAIVAIAVTAAFHDFVTLEIVLWWWAITIGCLEAAARAQVSCGAASANIGGFPRVARTLILALLVLWGIVQPAWSRSIWRSGEASPRLVDAAVAAEPWFAEPLEWRVRTLMAEGPLTWQRAAEAVARSRQAVRVHPGSFRLWLLLGQLQFRIVNELGPWPDSVAEARRAFTRAAELEPHLPWPWLELARLERGFGDLDEAARLARLAVAEEPNAVRALLFLARIELDRGNVEPARQAYVRALEAAGLRRRLGLSELERELLAAPEWQFREIAEALP